MDWHVLMNLTWQAWVTLGVVIFVLGAMVLTHLAADIVLVAGVTILVMTGVLNSSQAFAGMANDAMLTVAVLYVVACAIDATGATGWAIQKLLRRPKTVTGAIARMMFPVSFISAWLNNTPVVAMFMPAVNVWARRNNIASSKLMIPLSYAAVLGGCCTLIGTSSNLVVNGLLIRANKHPMNMFDIAWVGVPCTVLGIIMVVALQKWLLPDRRRVIDETDDPREYTVLMRVDPAGPLVGQTIERAGLRHLPKTFVAGINRGELIMPAVSPHEKLQADDELVFVGIIDSVVDLQKIRGLVPATNQVFKLGSQRVERCLIEAVVSSRCPLIGQTIRDGRFRSVYNAVVVAVARSGERINKKIGDIILQPGDTLLLEALPTFVEQQHNSRHFFLVSRVENSSPVRHEKALVAIAIMLAMVVAASFEWLSMLVAGMLAAGAMLITRCITSQMARRSVDWNVLIAIAASLAIGLAIEKTGLAQVLASQLIGLSAGHVWWSLVVVYGIGLLVTELIANNAAAALVFPIAMQTASQLHVNHMPFVIAVAVSASFGFAIPLAYQTHMMVYGPGGYRFTDFLKIGIPLDILCWIVTVLIVPLAFPF